MSVYTPIDYEHDPFEVDPIRRDQWQRPLLIPAGGSEADRRPYTRASTLASAISPDYGLRTWKMRRLAKGLSERPDLAAHGAALARLTGIRELDRDTNRELDFLIEEALREGGAYVDAQYGTTIHKWTEPEPQSGRGQAPQVMQADIDSFNQALEAEELRIVDTEVFVACDELNAAGTLDHIVEHIPTGKRCVLEKKTGDLHMFEFLVQNATYSHGHRYDPHTDRRVELDALPNFGILAHIIAGAGRTDFYDMDLALGLHLAHLAVESRKHQANDAQAGWRLRTPKGGK